MVTGRPGIIAWLADAEEHSFPAAESYLSPICSEKRAARMVTKLRAADIVNFKAEDIFRASRRSLVGVSNLHVERDKKKIQAGTSLSPLLLIRDESNGKVVVADGYHRLCAVYAFDKDAWIDCMIVQATGSRTG